MIGICVGSQNTVIGVLKNGNVDIILSETSSRCVPTLTAFHDKERLFGDQAMSTIKSNFSRTFIYPNRFLGLTSNSPFYEEEKKHSLAQPSIDSSGKIGFEVKYKGETNFFYPEAIMGIFFNKLKENWRKNGYNTRDIVVSVPDYFDYSERKAMLDAIAIADLNPKSLINESSAISLNYSIFRRNQFDEKTQKIVAFVDMGQSKCSVFFSSFTKNNQKVLSVTNERNCGARDFDYILMEFFSNMFQKKYGCNPITSTKLRIRMVDAISKMRKILTSNREAQLSIESLMEDEDLNYLLTRDEFEKIISPITDKFRQTLVNALQNSGLKLEEISAVEMVGDAIRTPILQQIILEVFNKEVSKTLAPDETIARGATVFSAMNSPYFNIKDFTFDHYNPYSVILEYPFVKDNDLQIRKQKIINKGDNFPNKKSIKFNEKQTPKESLISLKFLYNQEEVPHLQNTLTKNYSIAMPNIKEEQFLFVIHFMLDTHGLPVLEKASVNEIYYEEVKKDPPKKEEKKEKVDTNEPPKEGESKEETPQFEKVKKERSNLCNIKLVECCYGMSESNLDNLVLKEANLENDDKLLNQARAKRNDIENYLYSTRSKLDNEFYNYIDENNKVALLEEMQRLEDWLYNDEPGKDEKAILDKQSNKMYDLGSKIYNRFENWKNLQTAIENYDISIKKTIEKFSAEYDKFDKGQKTNLVKEDCEVLNDLVVKANNNLNELINQIKSVPTIATPPLNSKDVNKIVEEFKKAIKEVYDKADKREQEKIKKQKEEEKKLKDDEEKRKKDEEDKNKPVEDNKKEEKSNVMDVD